jgi:hypothetical protein
MGNHTYINTDGGRHGEVTRCRGRTGPMAELCIRDDGARGCKDWMGVAGGALGRMVMGG